MAYYQNVLKDFISTKLNVNTKDILFDVNLYNDIAPDDKSQDSVIDNSYTLLTKKYVPTMITNINGEYLPIPNVTATTNSVEIVFDLAVDDMSGIEETKFESVDYNNTLLAIDEFRKELLAKYHPLGTGYLMFGGDDSSLTLTNSVAVTLNTIYLELVFKNNDEETLFESTGTNTFSLKKTATRLEFYASTTLLCFINYSINETTKLVIFKDVDDKWTMTDGTNSYTYAVPQTAIIADEFVIGDTTGCEIVLHRFLVDDDVITSTDAGNAIDNGIDTIVTAPDIDISDFDDRYTITNDGSVAFTGVAENVLVIGSDGNAIFDVYPLTTLGQYSPENGINYHSFSLQLDVLVSEEIVFGNNFEYFIDDIQVYPVDRGHTLGTDLGSGQKINSDYNEHIVEESSREHTMTFFYNPTKQLTKLLKHIVSGSVSQNNTYELKVQYPFFKVTYDVIIENGGTNPNVNTLSTFTVTFKRKTSFLT